MKPASGAMISLLTTNGPFFMADLYTIKDAYGGVSTWTDFDNDLSVGGTLYSAETLVLTRTKTKLSTGLDTDTMTVTLAAPPSATIQTMSPYYGMPWLMAIQKGYLDGARINVDRMVTNDWGDTSFGSIPMFYGRVSDVDVSRGVATIKVNTDLDLLNLQLPKNLFQAGCLNTLYDGGCLANRSAFTFSGTVGGGSTSTSIVLSGVTTQPDGYFALGTMKFTSGTNINGVAGVRDFASGVATLTYPLVNAPSVGDAFTITAGCDKQLTTCTNKFSNQAHFRGFPYVPPPETVT